MNEWRARVVQGGRLFLTSSSKIYIILLSVINLLTLLATSDFCSTFKCNKFINYATIINPAVFQLLRPSNHLQSYAL